MIEANAVGETGKSESLLRQQRGRSVGEKREVSQEAGTEMDICQDGERETGEE